MTKIQKKLYTRFKTVFVYGLSQTLAPVTQLIISLIIIRSKSIIFWGTYVEILIWINLMLLFTSFGNRDYLLKQFSKNPANINQLWLGNFVNRTVLLLLCLLIIFFSPFFSHILFISIAWISLLFINQSFNTLILYTKNFKFSLFVESVFNGIIILLVSFTIETLTIKSFITIILIAQLVRAVLYFYYYRQIIKTSMTINLMNLKYSIPFFLPLAIGTFRMKTDTYFANSFFEPALLGKYQILISFLAIGTIITSFFINPYLKNFFRLNQNAIQKIKKQFFVMGFVFAFLFIIMTYFIIKYIYKLEFTNTQYILTFLFLIPLLVHTVIINQIFKNDMQNMVSVIALIVVILQIAFGFFLVKYYGINGALFLKVISQWLITATLWLWLKNAKKQIY